MVAARLFTPFAGLSLAVLAQVANADILVRSSSDNGFFTPFQASNVATTTYGDSWWIGNTGNSYFLQRITLGLAAVNSTSGGSTSITLTLHDGDPSGLIFGNGAPLFSTTIHSVSLPDTANGSVYFDLSVALPNVQTTGGFNNIGVSVSLSNFNYDGQVGFQLSTANGQSAGFYTNNASYNPGSGWSLFAFGPDSNFGVGNYTVLLEGIAVPSPAFASAALLGAFAIRRRR